MNGSSTALELTPVAEVCKLHGLCGQPTRRRRIGSMPARPPTAALRCLAFVLLLLLINAAACFAADSVRVSRIALHLPAGEIRADVFEKTERKEQPVIIVLHGAGGTLVDGPEMRRVARHLAEGGNAVYLLHYFERTGTLFALDSTMQRHFPEWLQTVRDAIPAVQRLRGNAKPVGLYGYSLGGFLALAAASDNARVAAVVEHAGGVWNGQMDRIGRMPAVLMVHGESDSRVPPAHYATPLRTVLRKRAARVETRFFPSEGHVFSPAAMTQVRAAAAKFFRQHLRAD